MTKRRCAACGQLFKPCPQVPHQAYCSEPSCQRERRRCKQKEKRQSSLALRDSDAQYLRDWAAKHPGYWKQYRASHPEYVEQNRKRQHERNIARVAKDDLKLPYALPAGRYQLIPVGNDIAANEDVWIVEITVLSAPASIFTGDCKMKT